MAESQKPTVRIQKALDELLQYNGRTRGRVSGSMYLGKDIFIVTLREPKIVNGEWEEVDRTVDIFDLMDAHQAEQEVKEL